MNPWEDMFRTATKAHIKKYFFDILQERYGRNEEFLDRLSTMILTGKDMEGLGKLISDLYEVGYLKATKDHRNILEQRGLTAVIRPEPQIDSTCHRIFPQSKED